jgi:hypothetical protein
VFFGMVYFTPSSQILFTLMMEAIRSSEE